jgi:hypothetical protein
VRGRHVVSGPVASPGDVGHQDRASAARRGVGRQRAPVEPRYWMGELERAPGACV